MLPAICILSVAAVKSLSKVLAKVLFIKSWCCCCFYCCRLIAPRVPLRIAILSRRQKLDEQAPLGNLDDILYLVTSELEWPFIFELWPRMPHKWRYNILPFIPSPSPSTNFAPEAFHRNGFQETLSFDPELQGQIVTDEEEKKEKSLRSSCENSLSWCYLCMGFNTLCGEGWLQMLTGWLQLCEENRSAENGKSFKKRGSSPSVWKTLGNGSCCFTRLTLLSR